MRRNRSSLNFARPIAAAAVVALVASGCHDSATSAMQPVDHDVAGSWAEDFGGIAPGFSFQLTMNEASGVVSGAGSSRGEAIAPDTLSIAGTVARDSLHLQIVFTIEPASVPNARPDTGQFTGVLTTRDQIDGTLSIEGTNQAIRLLRTQP